jgi:Bacterial PH domain
VDFESEVELQAQLSANERILWSGRPMQGFVLRPADAFLIPFSLLWGGFAFFWEYSVLSTVRAPSFFALWGIPFVLAGVYIIVGRFFVDNWQRKRTLYGVTNQGVIILSGLLSKNIKSLNLRGVSDLSLTERRNGLGSISFGPMNPYSSWVSGAAWPGFPQTAMFELIPDAKRVYEIIRTAQVAAP